MTAYNKLPLVPTIVAKMVCGKKYTGYEVSDAIRNESLVAVVEERRIHMSSIQMEEFAYRVDERCKKAYKAKAKWFMKCINDDDGLDQLYMWVTHWLAAYLMKSSFKDEVHKTCRFYVCFDSSDDDVEGYLPFITTDIEPHYTIEHGPMTEKEASFALSTEIGRC